MKPVATRLVTYLVASAAFGLASWGVLMVLAGLRTPDSSATPGWDAYLLGAAIVVGVQTLVAWGAWTWRLRR